MKQILEIIEENNYTKVKFKISKTQHLLIRAKINGVAGNFILDTGASNSCVGFESISLFHLDPRESMTKASGAGATGMQTQIAPNTKLQLGRWKSSTIELVIFDLSHVNEALVAHKSKTVHGIIGADVLLRGKAIIDYYNHYLYLQK
jgi:predicted aspartyl protease